MTEPSKAQLHPLAALSVASRQNEFDRSEKLILASDVCILKDMLAERDARIKELEDKLGEPAVAEYPEPDFLAEQETE